MTATVSYEVHVMRGGRWVTSGVYQDKGDALRDARGPMRKRCLGIRVIEEIFDPERDRFVTRTLYRDQSRVEQDGPQAEANGGAPRRPAAVSAQANLAAIGEPFKVAAFTLITVSSVILFAIGGLFWLGLV